jgi:hypothetical protein
MTPGSIPSTSEEGHRKGLGRAITGCLGPTYQPGGFLRMNLGVPLRKTTRMSSGEIARGLPTRARCGGSAVAQKDSVCMALEAFRMHDGSSVVKAAAASLPPSGEAPRALGVDFTEDASIGFGKVRRRGQAFLHYILCGTYMALSCRGSPW